MLSKLITMNFQAMSKQRKFILIAALIGVISIFLPWVSVGFGGFGITVNGFHSWGILCFLAFVGAGIIAYMGDQTSNLPKTMWFAALVCGGLSLLGVLIFLSEAGGASGFGLYIGLLAAIAVAGSAWMFKNPGDDFKSGFDSLKKEINDKTQSTNTPNNPPL